MRSSCARRAEALVASARVLLYSLSAFSAEASSAGMSALAAEARRTASSSGSSSERGMPP